MCRGCRPLPPIATDDPRFVGASWGNWVVGQFEIVDPLPEIEVGRLLRERSPVWVASSSRSYSRPILGVEATMDEKQVPEGILPETESNGEHAFTAEAPEHDGAAPPVIRGVGL